MTDKLRPRMQLLSDDRVEAIVDEAYDVLESVGVEIEFPEAVELLTGSGATASDDGRRVFISRDLCRRCLESAPREFRLYGRDGREVVVGGDHTHFDPGSAALTLYDYETAKIRKPTSRDVVEFAVLSDGIGAYDCQSTGLIPFDVPENLADRYRLLIALVYGTKPVITGTFTREAFSTMYALLSAVRGGGGGIHASKGRLQ
jgi:trimethylamine--corrinoid protein Co-methyltransferase